MQINSSYFLYNSNNNYTNATNQNHNTDNTSNTSQESQTTLLSDEEARKQIYEFFRTPQKSSLEANFDILTEDESVAKLLDWEKTREKQLINRKIPNEAEFQVSIEYLLDQIDEILIKGLQENPDDLKFKNLLEIARQGSVRLHYESNSGLPYKSYAEFRQEALEALLELKSGTLNKDFNDTMSDYMASSSGIGMSIGRFFYYATEFEMIPPKQKDKIMNALDTTQIYLFNQGGWSGWSDNKTFQLGDAIISWSGEQMPFRPYSDGVVEINFLKSNDILASLASSFDSTQSFFDILEKREQLERTNQELKAKQGMQTYVALKDSTTDSIMQTLLRDSRG